MKKKLLINGGITDDSTFKDAVVELDLTSWNPVIFTNRYSKVTFGNLDDMEIEGPEDVPQEILDAYVKLGQTLYNWYTDPSKFMLVLKIRGETYNTENLKIFSICINKLSYYKEYSSKNTVFKGYFSIGSGVDATVTPNRFFEYVGICQITIPQDLGDLLVNLPSFTYRQIYDRYK